MSRHGQRLLMPGCGCPGVPVGLHGRDLKRGALALRDFFNRTNQCKDMDYMAHDGLLITTIPHYRSRKNKFARLKNRLNVLGGNYGRTNVNNTTYYIT